MLWRAALTRRISRMVFKCRLSLTSPVRTTTRNSHGLKGANGLLSSNGGSHSQHGGGSKRSSSAARADNAYLLAVFFVFFLLVMIVTQVMVMRSELSASVAGKSHPRSFRPAPASSSSSAASSSASRRHHQPEPNARPFRFGRQPAPFGRVLAADTGTPNTAGGGDTNAAGPSPDLIHDPPNPLTAGEWLGRLPQQQGRDAWVDQLWQCYQGRSLCPWQPVAGRDKCFVYSAYLDESSPLNNNGPTGNNPGSVAGVVRVIGVAKTKRPERVWCQLGRTISPENGTVSWTSVLAQIKTIREHWNLRYSAVFILCPLPRTHSGQPFIRPEFVSISTSPNPVMIDRDLPRPTSSKAEFNQTFGHWSSSLTGNLLPIIRYSDELSRTPPKHQLSVCVKPLHYSFDRAGQLIEFIEIHRLLGVSHFTFYNHTVGDQVDCVLRQYAEQGLVDVLPWRQLDVVSQKEIRTEGIFASLNDCLYRHMFDSQYLLMIDLDELIVPRTKFSLTDMIASTMINSSVINSNSHNLNNGRNNHNRIGAYYFRNAFFYLSWPDDSGVHPDWTGQRLDLISLRKTRRNVKLHPHRFENFSLSIHIWFFSFDLISDFSSFCCSYFLAFSFFFLFSFCYVSFDWRRAGRVEAVGCTSSSLSCSIVWSVAFVLTPIERRWHRCPSLERVWQCLLWHRWHYFYRIRSKYICRPRTVVEVGNHFVWEFRAGHVAAHVPDSLAVMHHYRTCEFGGDTCLSNPSVQDRSAWKYGDPLVLAVRHRFQQFGQTCPAILSEPQMLPSQHSPNKMAALPIAAVNSNSLKNATVLTKASPSQISSWPNASWMTQLVSIKKRKEER